ncbi:SurA N-terminal domain-containing protein [Methylomagnum sp.]
MLQAIRDRAQGIFAWVMLILIGVPFALWGIQNYMDTGKEQPAATVGGHEIFDRDVSRAYEQNIASLVGVADYDEKQMRHEALERLIREEVIAQSAEDKSLAVSDADVRGFIQTLPYFQTDGKFDKEKYKVMLSAQHMTPNQLVAQIRRALVMEQYQRGVLDSAFVTKDQVDMLLRLRNQEREIEYATVPLRLVNRTFPDAEIEAYYREHLPEFGNPEQVSIEYVTLNLDDLAKQVQVTEADLRNLYEEQKASFGTEERRKASHILIPVEKPDEAADKAALAKIAQIRERLVKGEDFAKVAKEVSGDSVSAKQGGDLGFINKDAMEENFAKAAFALNQGDLSEPVKTSFGYHLIKVTELVPARVKSFEEVKDELSKTFQHNAAENKFYDLGQTLTEQSFEHPDSLEPAAKQLNLKVEQTGLFTRDAGEGVASEEAVRKAAFSEEVLSGRNSDPVELGNEKAMVLRVKEHRPASDKPLADVKTAIIERLKDQEARRVASQQVDGFTKQVREGRSFAEVAKAAGLQVVKPPALRRSDDKLPHALVGAVFKAPRPAEGKPTLQGVEVENGERIVFNLLAVKDGAAAPADAKELDSAREFLSRSEGQREFSSFVARLREIADVWVKPET